jgi:hypothetical protein
MTDAEPASPSNQLGVVDPMRVPGQERARRFWDRLPLLGRAFLVAAGIDLLVRLSGVAGLPGSLELGAPLAFGLFFVAHYALLLFPVVVLWCRPDAAEATPRILQGAVALAVVELASDPLGLWLSPAGGDITGWSAFQLAAALVRGAGYLALAYGLLAIDRSVPTPTAAGLANLVGGAIVLAAVVSILLQLLGPQADLGRPDWNTQVLMIGIAGELATITFAFLARAVIRGATDLTRPRTATIVAAGAMVISGVNAFLTLVVGVLVLLQSVFALSTPVLQAGVALGFLGGGGLVLALLVVAFGLGLGDVSATMPANPTTKESRA